MQFSNHSTRVRQLAVLQILFALALMPLSGCDQLKPSVAPTLKPVGLPNVNIPRAEREWNWGGGSCVHASTVMHLRWQNAMEMADYWRKTYSGGESYNGL